ASPVGGTRRVVEHDALPRRHSTGAHHLGELLRGHRVAHCRRRRCRRRSSAERSVNRRAGPHPSRCHGRKFHCTWRLKGQAPWGFLGSPADDRFALAGRWSCSSAPASSPVSRRGYHGPWRPAVPSPTTPTPPPERPPLPTARSFKPPAPSTPSA